MTGTPQRTGQPRCHATPQPTTAEPVLIANVRESALIGKKHVLLARLSTNGFIERFRFILNSRFTLVPHVCPRFQSALGYVLRQRLPENNE